MAKVTFDEERCKGCGLCETVCPKQIITLAKEKINVKGYH
ncbi:MAG: 4Fe-4S binding protein, partial [Clostridia bacterium]|nr:4Fe-4S binding protein [Clostridia bacterium]